MSTHQLLETSQLASEHKVASLVASSVNQSHGGVLLNCIQSN